MFGQNKDSSRKNGTSGDRPPTTYRRLRHGRSVLMQGLASRKNHRNSRNPRNDNRRAVQVPAWLGLSHLSHVSVARVTARMPIVIGFVTRVTPVTPVTRAPSKSRGGLARDGPQLSTYPPCWPTRPPAESGADLRRAIEIRAGAHAFEAKVFNIVSSALAHEHSTLMSFREGPSQA